MTPMLYYMGSIGVLFVLIACTSAQGNRCPQFCTDNDEVDSEGRQKRNTEAFATNATKEGGGHNRSGNAHAGNHHNRTQTENNNANGTQETPTHASSHNNRTQTEQSGNNTANHTRQIQAHSGSNGNQTETAQSGNSANHNQNAASGNHGNQTQAESGNNANQTATSGNLRSNDSNAQQNAGNADEPVTSRNFSGNAHTGGHHNQTQNTHSQNHGHQTETAQSQNNGNHTQIAVDTEETLFGPERAARNQTAHRHPRSVESEEVDEVLDLSDE
ncbi:GATA zinc finger domain-containing protein 14-like [Paramacrobiotus metropolitanus]|uniref:GATA zinc finger domain-containing protein 14-like n=1 Tax=Paramacrobiotus metropolitanus TaxID=2943436 RepID=UPI0024460082|nr:GATA zinc finger domain-containing protein 14-like [Paramacrobiotus metropolitanus]